jgi:hypothetical protein
VRRSARTALELAAPERVLAPLQVLELPCNLVRQGLGRVWDLGLKLGHAAGRHLGQEFGLLARAVMRPIQVVLQEIAKVQEAATVEPELERKVDPVRFRMGR